MDDLYRKYPEKCLPEDEIFRHIHRGDRIFIGTGCGEPQYLVQALLKFVDSHPTAFYDAEVFHVWTLGVAPYMDEKFKQNFRHNFFFIGENVRDAVNKGLADYTPVFSSKVPGLFEQGIIPLDVALIQTSLPDRQGYLSLGISVDIVKSAVKNASLVIAQLNSGMPRAHGDSFIHVSDVDFLVPHNEPLLEYHPSADSEITRRIGKYVARLVCNGDTLQIGVGRILNAILNYLSGKKHLGIHTELLTDGLVELMRQEVVDNSQKGIHRGKTVATFCMGTQSTYDYVCDNPAIEFYPVDYTNNPLVIARNQNMTAINNAIEIDLTGQATTESVGKQFYRGIGGQADFMRGASLAPNGKTILVLESTAQKDTISRIVPFLQKGAGVTLNRGDIDYVVTEYGIAYLPGKNIRERAMALIAIAHPDFRPWLIEEAKKHHIIYQDQAFIPGKRGEYPEELETHRATKSGLDILLRPVKISDEPLLKDFFYSLSDQSLFFRFFHNPKKMPHEFLQKFAVIDYTRYMVILATIQEGAREEVVAIAQYSINEADHTAEVAFAVRDDYQNKGIGKQLLSYLTTLARKNGILGFTASMLADNHRMLHLFKKMGFPTEIQYDRGTCEMTLMFK